MTYNTNPEMTDTMAQVGIEEKKGVFIEVWPTIDGKIMTRIARRQDGTCVYVIRKIS